MFNLHLAFLSGTLADQMTYPDVRGAEDLTLEKLQSLLRAVDLEYLLDRTGAMTDEINWEDELSLGGECEIQECVARTTAADSFMFVASCTVVTSSSL